MSRISQPVISTPAPPAQQWSRERVVATTIVLILTVPSPFFVLGYYAFPLLAAQVAAIVVTPFLAWPQSPGDTKLFKIFAMTGLAIGLTPAVIGLLVLILAPYIY